MMLQKLDAYTKLIANLADKPNLSASDLKAYFDNSPEEIRVAFNNLIDALKAITDGDSGADNIGVTAIQGLSGATVQALLEAVKTQLDNKATNGGDWTGTWQGLEPTQADPALTSKVDAHLADDVSHVKYGVATGTANTYAVSLNTAPTEYIEGMALSVKINVDATGASTLNVNGLGAIPIKKANGNDGTNLKANGIYTLRYDGTNFILQGEGGEGTAQPSDVLTGKTFTNDSDVQTGTMINNVNSGIAITPNNTDQAIPKGYYGGNASDGVVKATTIIAGESTIITNAGSDQANSTTLQRYPAKFTMTKNGIVRVKFDQRTTNSSYPAYGQVYKNGIAVGTLRSTPNQTFLTYSEDFSCNIGDYFEIYHYCTNIAYGCMVSNFRLCIDEQIATLSS